MIICPACRHQEYDGELFCSECGARIWSASDEPPPTASFDSGQLRDIARPPSGDVAVASLQPGQISLAISNAPKAVLLEGRQEYLLGREGPDEQSPDIDLSAYGARDKGVSRIHASLRMDRRQLLLMDLGSTNGTRLNGTPLAAHEPVRLENGDEILLGKLALKIYFNL